MHSRRWAITRPGPTARRWPPACAWPPSWVWPWAGGTEDDLQALTKLLQAFDLPVHIPCSDADWAVMEETVGLDKKSTGDSISLILLEVMGKAKAVKMKKTEVLAQLDALYGRV